MKRRKFGERMGKQKKEKRKATGNEKYGVQRKMCHETGRAFNLI